MTCGATMPALLPSWGVFDRVDECWLGTNDEGTGPRTYADRALATVAENLLRVRFGYPARRLTVLQYDGSGTREKDSVEPMRSNAEAFDILGWSQVDAFGDGAA
jgi:hypothetical protein